MGKYKTYLQLAFSGNQAKRRSTPCSSLLNSTSITQFFNCYSNVFDSLTLIASGLNKPISIIFDNNNNLYVTIDSTNQIIKIDSQGTITPFISSGLFLPVAMVFDENFEYMYVTNFGNNTISVINMETLSIGTLTLNYDSELFPSGYPLDQPNGMCFDSTFENLYVTNVNPITNNIVKINISTLESSVFVPNILSPILITADNNTPCNFYVTCLVQSIIYKIDYNGNRTLFSNSPLLYGPRAITFNLDYTKLYVTNSNQNNNYKYNDIIVFDLSGNIVSFLKSTYLEQPRGLCFNYENYLYISNFGNGTIYKLISNII
jgi:DNA-binding beta-propeller fold protein YncE